MAVSRNKEIAELRKKIGCSQYKLSILTGMSRFRISLIECGYAKPTKAEVITVRKALAELARTQD